MACLTVVIPYFQRLPGLLARAVASVLEQDTDWATTVLVVDDGSPIRATDELAGLVGMADRITVIRQDNAGPGAARNRALDQLPQGTDFVGFIDSDDWWEPGLVRTAEQAFGHSDVDLFFTDSRRFGKAETRFQWESDAALNLSGSGHQCIDATLDLHEFAGDFFDFMIHRSSIIGTSSMIFRRRAAAELRFDTSLYNGQDRLFKLELARRVNRVRFATRALSGEGEGINIFDSATWGTGRALRLAASYISLGKKVRSRLGLTASQLRFVDDQIRASRRDFAGNLLRLLRRDERIDWALVMRALRQDPALLGVLPKTLGSSLMNRLAVKQGPQR